MEQIIINVEDTSIIPSLKRILKSIKGITIVKHEKKEKNGLEEAFDDIQQGRVTHYESAEAMFKSLGI